jgi:predicted flavoprotein YhiN
VKFEGAVVIGAGPAGLWAAEALAHSGVVTHIFDHESSLGRKFFSSFSPGKNALGSAYGTRTRASPERVHRVPSMPANRLKHLIR